MLERSHDRDNARAMATELLSAFVWSDTPEGARYWDDVYVKLITLAGWDAETSTWIIGDDD